MATMWILLRFLTLTLTLTLTLVCIYTILLWSQFECAGERHSQETQQIYRYPILNLRVNSLVGHLNFRVFHFSHSKWNFCNFVTQFLGRFHFTHSTVKFPTIVDLYTRHIIFTLLFWSPKKYFFKYWSR